MEGSPKIDNQPLPTKAVEQVVVQEVEENIEQEEKKSEEDFSSVYGIPEKEFLELYNKRVEHFSEESNAPDGETFKEGTKIGMLEFLKKKHEFEIIEQEQKSLAEEKIELVTKKNEESEKLNSIRADLDLAPDNTPRASVEISALSGKAVKVEEQMTQCVQHDKAVKESILDPKNIFNWTHADLEEFYKSDVGFTAEEKDLLKFEMGLREEHIKAVSSVTPETKQGAEVPLVAEKAKEDIKSDNEIALETIRGERYDAIVQEIESNWIAKNGPIVRDLSENEIAENKKLAKLWGNEWDGRTTQLTEAGSEFYFDHRGNGKNSVPDQAERELLRRYPEYAVKKEELKKIANEPIAKTASAEIVQPKQESEIVLPVQQGVLAEEENIIQTEPVPEIEAEIPLVGKEQEVGQSQAVETPAKIFESEKENLDIQNQRIESAKTDLLDSTRPLVGLLAERSDEGATPFFQYDDIDSFSNYLAALENSTYSPNLESPLIDAMDNNSHLEEVKHCVSELLDLFENAGYKGGVIESDTDDHGKLFEMFADFASNIETLKLQFALAEIDADNLEHIEIQVKEDSNSSESEINEISKTRKANRELYSEIRDQLEKLQIETEEAVARFKRKIEE